MATKSYRFDMPVEYHTALKTIAAQEQTTVKEILIELVKDYLINKKAIEA